MPPKSKRSFNVKSLFSFRSSKPKVKGSPSGDPHLDEIATGISERFSQPSSASAPSPSPPHRPDPDPLALQSVSDHVVAPLLDPATVVGSLAPLASSSTPTASPSLFANANHFRLQNLYYQNVQALSPSVDNPSRSEAGWKILLEHTATSALYDSSARFNPPQVDEGTRVNAMERITAWIDDRESPTRLLCMTGAAGAGKSALQQTITERCALSKVLAASFFFSSSDPSRNDVSAIVPTIAYQLGLVHPHLRRWIGEAVDNDQLIFTKSLKTQMDTLIVGPVGRLRSQMGPVMFSSLPYLITIDGLDECLDALHQTELLSVIRTSFLCGGEMPFRIFLASRPELSIRTALEGHLEGFVYHLRLSDDFDATDDIRRWLWRRLREIGTRSGDLRAQPHLWPTEEDVEFLVMAASGQFVYAATVTRYISERRGSPIKRLQTVLGWRDVGPPSNTAPFAELDLLYSSVLSNAKEAWEAANPDSPYDFVVLLRIFERFRNSSSPSSRFLVPRRYHESNDFCLLLGLDNNALDTITLDLRSLVSVVRVDHYDTLHLYHRSFTEFLDTAARSKDFYRSRLLVFESYIRYLMRQICDSSDPGATQSLPSTLWWFFRMDAGSIPEYEISHDLYEASLRFTCNQGWDKFFKIWRPGRGGMDNFSTIREFAEGGIIHLFALVLEYSVDKDSDQEVIATIRKHHAHLREQNASFLARQRRERSNLVDFKELPFPRFSMEDDDDNL